jgi:hypothetical protein
MAIARIRGAEETIHRFKEGDRVVVGDQWHMANRHDVIKETHRTTGNRLLVGFDQDELGVWHDEDGDPVFLVSAKDLLPSEAQALVAIEQPARIWHISF